MTQSKPIIQEALPCGDETVYSGREAYQKGWYAQVALALHGGGYGNLLDVGCGHWDNGLDAMEMLCDIPNLIGLEVDDRIENERILNATVDQIPAKSFDIVTCFDVIEHVREDMEFFEHLRRIARHRLFISTPNINHHGCKHPYHFREFTPEEFQEFFKPDELIHGKASGHSLDAQEHMLGVWKLD